MCAMRGPVYVCYWWPCMCMLRVALYNVIWVAMYMFAMDGLVYVWYR